MDECGDDIVFNDGIKEVLWGKKDTVVDESFVAGCLVEGDAVNQFVVLIEEFHGTTFVLATALEKLVDLIAA